jgi:hypothetical protein
MAEGGAWAGAFGWLVGTGPGAGMGLMFVFTGLLGAAVGLGGYLFPAVRNVEDIMPDHDANLRMGEWANQRTADSEELADLPIR